MEKSDCKIIGMTIAVINMEKMLDFYSKIFGIEFTEQDMNGVKLYTGKWGGLNLLFCPAEFAGIWASQNRHQFDINIPDIHKTIPLALELGGRQIGEIREEEHAWSGGVYDPDNNSITLQQLKELTE